MNIHPLAPASLVAASLMLASCGGGGGGGGIGGTGTGDSGTMRMALTDAPACGFDAVNVTIERVRVHQSAGAAEGIVTSGLSRLAGRVAIAPRILVGRASRTAWRDSGRP